MASTIFNLAKKHFTEQSIKDDFLEALKDKGYIKDKTLGEDRCDSKKVSATFCGDLVKALFMKKYITKEIYDSILEEYGQEKKKACQKKVTEKKKLTQKKKACQNKTVKKKVKLGEIKENPLIEMVEELEEKSAIKNETYEITDEGYIDYENIQIDGVEYYLHKENLSIVDVYDFRDMGFWDKEKCGIVFLNSGCSERHSSRISSC
jgi:hypothetical protein